jgi:hypothetical protein
MAAESRLTQSTSLRARSTISTPTHYGAWPTQSTYHADGSVGETGLTSAFTCTTPPERPIPAADHALVDGLQRLPGNKRPNQARHKPTGHMAALRAHAASSACRPRALPLRSRARAGSERCATANTAHDRQVSLARRILAGQRLPATAQTGSSFGLDPAVEINLHLDHVCPAHTSSRAASEYAFRSLQRGYEPAPRPGWTNRTWCPNQRGRDVDPNSACRASSAR